MSSFDIDIFTTVTITDKLTYNYVLFNKFPEKIEKKF